MWGDVGGGRDGSGAGCCISAGVLGLLVHRIVVGCILRGRLGDTRIGLGSKVSSNINQTRPNSSLQSTCNSGTIVYGTNYLLGQHNCII